MSVPPIPTKHDDRCQMAFGRPKRTGCPRCAELLAGATPRRRARSWRTLDAQRVAEIQAHFASEQHRTGKCGIICTFGEW